METGTLCCQITVDIYSPTPTVFWHHETVKL